MGYTDQSFLEKIKPYILDDMRKTKILASLTAAQAFIESNKGNSGLTQQCNNLFGIKGDYKGAYGLFWTTEYYNGVKTRIQAKFRKYPSWAESIDDHSGLFIRSKRYSNLIGCTLYTQACKNVQADGYATSPSYANTLINTINKYKLYLWDEEVIGKAVPHLGNRALPVLKKGSRGEHVMAWQNYLSLNGYRPGAVDGIFGKLTEDAVKAFQSSRGLKADGIIGPKTWAAIGITS